MDKRIEPGRYSVLMTVYSGTQLVELRESLGSMAEQSVPPSEYVIVADGPLSDEVAYELETYDGLIAGIRLKLIKLGENRGAGYASKVGVEHCAFPLIARMDSDDISLPSRLEKQLRMMEEHPEYAAIGCWAREFITGEGIVSTVELPVEPDDLEKYARRRCPVRHPCLLINKEMLQKAGGYSDIRFAEEWDIVNKLIQAGYQCANIPEPLVMVRVGKDFYARRGGAENAKRILRFKWNMLKRRQMGLLDYLISASASVVVCFVPNSCRAFIYERLLRKPDSHAEGEHGSVENGRCS
jgi:glycosyltransferase involved in cell wall biosynthesis